VELDQLADVAPAEEASLSSLRDRVEALQPHAAASRLQVATSDRDLYEGMRKVAQTAASFPWEEYNSAVDAVQRAEELYLERSRTAFAGEAIPAIFSETWKEFIWVQLD
jgi:hypothetical protein